MLLICTRAQIIDVEPNADANTSALIRADACRTSKADKQILNTQQALWPLIAIFKRLDNELHSYISLSPTLCQSHFHDSTAEQHRFDKKLFVSPALY